MRENLTFNAGNCDNAFGKVTAGSWNLRKRMCEERPAFGRFAGICNVKKDVKFSREFVRPEKVSGREVRQLNVSFLDLYIIRLRTRL